MCSVGQFRGLEAVSTEHDPLLFLAALFFFFSNTQYNTLHAQDSRFKKKKKPSTFRMLMILISYPYLISEAQKLAFGS